MADSLINDDQINNTNAREEILNKWKDKPKEELLEAKAESDLYIKTLTARLDDITKDHLKLLEDSKAKAQLEELIARQEQLLTNKEPPQNTQREEIQPTIKTEDIEKLLEMKLAQHDQGKKWDDNFNTIKSKLKEQLGENYAETFKQRRDSLGLTQEFADELARKHPSVFLKTFLDEARSDSYTPPPRSGTRQTSFSPQTPKRDWNYYQALKKENPRLYLDPKISVQMHDDAIALGDAFGMPKD